MTIPKTYRKSRDPILANFDWTDIAAGTGYEDYFLIESEVDGGKDHHLTSQHDYSNSVDISVQTTTSTLDYDLTPFVNPRTINGVALISLAVYGLGGITPVYTVQLYKWDGSSETLLGTAEFEPTLTAARMLYMPITIVNKKIGIGETLRCKVILNNPSGSEARYGIDPANRTSGQLIITTTSKISIPYRLNL